MTGSQRPNRAEGAGSPRGFVRLAVLMLSGLLATFPVDAAAQAVTLPDSIAVVGVVVDREQGTPLPQVAVRLEWAGSAPPGADRPSLSALTDADGAFRIADVPVGAWTMSVSALGYRTLEEAIRVEGASPFTLSVRLAAEALGVEGIVVTIPRNPWLDRHGFYDRRMRGLGSFWTGEELDELGVYQMTDLFRRLSGVTLVSGGSPTSPYVTFRGGCPPDVVMDGLNMGHQVRIDDLVYPGDIEGLEVYRGAANPGLYSSNPCGSILIWTLGSASREGAAWSYRRALVALGFVIGGILLAR